MNNQQQPTYFQVNDDDGNSHNFTFKTCAAYMKKIGREKGNSKDSISRRHHIRTVRKYTMRMVAGFDPIPKYKKPKTDLSMLSKFNRTRLVSVSV